MTKEEAIAYFAARRNYNPHNGNIEAERLALAALRAQQEAEKSCEQCGGILYRQTGSGKIVPLEQRCGAKITPPCYQADGDGCAYQIYGDDNDEPIDRCKSCPLCYGDKARYHQSKEEGQ